MESLLKAFITLFVVMDPIGNLPIFIRLAKGMPTSEIKKNVNRSLLVAGILLFVFIWDFVCFRIIRQAYEIP